MSKRGPNSGRHAPRASSPHDRLFKATFSQPEHAASELKAVLPSALVERADWRTLRLESGQYVDQSLRHLQSDLLYSVQIAGRPARVLMVFEHQSTHDRSMSWRLLRYITRVWDRCAAERPGNKLPPVVAVVLHHGDRGWASSTRLQDFVDLGAGEVADALAPYVPGFRFVLDDLATQSDEALRARTLTELARATLVFLQRVRHARDPAAVLRPWMQTLLGVLKAPNGVDALSLLVRYTMESSTAGPEEVRRFFEKLGPGAQEAIVTAAEQLTAEARAEALVEGQVRLLTRQLERRFGPLPAGVRQRLAQADEAQLERWADAVLTVDSLEALLKAE